MQATFQRVVSLGPMCRTRFQMERHWGGAQTHWRTSKKAMPRVVFDYQYTPFSALLEYFARDFRGMLEIEDLAMSEGRLVNERFGTMHRHDFPEPPDLARDYERSISRHNHLCQRAREAFASPLPTLFIRNEALDPAQIDALSDAIAGLRRDKPFKLAVIDDTGLPPSDMVKDWTGNDPFWSKALSRWKVAPDEPAPRRLATIVKERSTRLKARIARRRSRASPDTTEITTV